MAIKSKYLHLLIALALAFAIPLQGMASVTAGMCMVFGHHDAGAAASHDHGPSHHEGHKADQSAHDAAGNGATDSERSSEAHCAPCVACCAAASISPAAQLFIPEAFPPRAIAALPFLPAGFLPEELDRPPLTL